KMILLSSRLNQIRSKLRPNVRLIAVSKGQTVEKIWQAVQAGQIDFGENYAQELLGHYTPSLRWHFIGHLQRNKVRSIIDKVTLIHSVDSPSLATEINKQAAKIGKRQDILIEVALATQLSSEQEKSGVSEEELFALVSHCNQLEAVRLCGLMTVPPFQEEPEKVRPYFAKLRNLRDEINRKTLYKEPLTELSIGMSHDFEVAQEEGATMVRIGTAIFGERS
ncbi:MAG: YggS family pyridoxal phosphate-dependent enzyme, partial [bacterium]|nr:YggS family pyridoxal phosphate-dependent enzyme [bacterium]